MHEQVLADEPLSLTDVAKIAPGRPTPNCVWRWCRRGVLARNGWRIRLEHVRVGGRIFSTRAWLEDFGRGLAEADSKYFCLSEAIANDTRTTVRGRRGQSPGQADDRRQSIADAERALDRAGVR